MKNIKIEEKTIGDGEPTFIIAEAGSNHNGKIKLAKRLIDTAAEAKVDAIKFQVFRADEMYPKKSGTADYLKNEKSVYRIIKEMEMPYEWLPELFSHCNKKGIVFLASTFDEESSDKLDEAGATAFKIASYECTHLPLIEHIAKKRKSIIMSTGLASIEEIHESLRAIYSKGNKDVALMHCVAKYPAPIENTNLRVIDELKSEFKTPVGMSDHSSDPLLVPMTAAALGANLIEKHFTLDKNLPGPDHKFAVEPHELKEMVKGIRKVELALGSSVKKITQAEEELYKFARRRVHAKKKIKKDEIFTKENIAILRSGKLKPGLDPKFFYELLGKTAGRDIEEGEGITRNLIK